MLSFIDLQKQYKFLKNEIDENIQLVLNHGQYINGPEVKELEEQLAKYVNVKHAIACANGTDALILPLMALNIKEGDLVFCPAFTFIATAEVISLRGGEPVFVDINPKTYNICPLKLEEAILRVPENLKEKMRAVISVDLFGLPCNYAALEKVCKKYNLTLIEDAAQGFGGEFNGKKASSFGEVGATSFFPAKPLGCYGDGGAIFTNDDNLAEIFKSIRSHGAGSHKYEHIRIGTNSRLDTIQAAILLIKLKHFPQELANRQQVASFYNEKLSSLVETPVVPNGYYSSWAQYTIRIEASKRESFMQKMKAEKIPTVVYYPKPLHLQTAFKNINSMLNSADYLRESEKATKEVLSLPMHPYLSEEDLNYITNSFIKVFKSL